MRIRNLARALLVLGAAGAVVCLLLPRRRTGPAVLGNEHSHVYHLPHCRFAPSQEDAAAFPSAEAAEAAGYRACKSCMG
jgi:hypothetical protein